MVRRHGWQLPAHTLQVAAITVFFLLAVAYYIFLAPFVWLNSIVTTAYAVYTPLALAVFLLYVRCTAINPADPGVSGNQQSHKHTEKDSSESSVRGVNPRPWGQGLSLHSSNPSSLAPSVKEIEAKESSLEEGQVVRNRRAKLCSCAGLCGLCFGWVVIPDDGCGNSNPQQPTGEEEILFCTLCNVEVLKFSKHCRSCDKCVDGFDHHCRWLNNCIGKRNYKTFVALMATSLMLLIVEWVVGAAVFVRCFVDRHDVGDQIRDKLGNGFTRAPFATVVAVCTVVAMLACIPLGELFFFHLILIKKGITTYEYVVAVRAQPRGLSTEDERSAISSTSSSTVAGMSRSSSVGIQQHGGWCTPPRIFVEHQDEVVPQPGSRTVSSTVHKENPNPSQKSKPGNVRISAWRLAKLNKEEAARAAAKARETSSVLRPVGPLDLKGLTESEESYSSTSSRQSSVSTDFGLPGVQHRDGEDMKGSLSLSPYKSELPRIRTGRELDNPLSWSKRIRVDPKSAGSQTEINPTTTFPNPLSSAHFPVGKPDYIVSELPSAAVPAPQKHSESAMPSSSKTQQVGPSNTTHTGLPLQPAPPVGRSGLTRAVGATFSDGYDASGGETTDDMSRDIKGKSTLGRNINFSPSGSKNAPFFANTAVSRYGGPSSASRTIQFKGRGISTSVLSAYQTRPSNWRDPSSSPSSASDGDLATSDIGPYSTSPSPSRPSHPSAKLPSIPRRPSNLQFSGPSIFYSSPLMPIGESSGRRQQHKPDLPPKPSGTLRSGNPKHSAPGSSSRSTSRLAAMQSRTPPSVRGMQKNGTPPSRES